MRSLLSDRTEERVCRNKGIEERDYAGVYRRTHSYQLIPGRQPELHYEKKNEHNIYKMNRALLTSQRPFFAPV